MAQRLDHATDINAPWSWHGPETRVTGPAWGGSLEVIDFHLRASRYLVTGDRYDGAVLYAETSEELPPASYVYRVLTGMGERGLLQRFAAMSWLGPSENKIAQWLELVENANPDESVSSRWPTTKNAG